MSRNKNKSKKKTVSVDPPVSTSETVKQVEGANFSATIDYVIKVLITALLFSRFFLTAENADEGGTLGLVFLLVVATVAWFGNRILSGDCRLRLGWIDAAVYMLVAGHVISAGIVLGTSGQKQHALNMLIEWAGIGLAFFMLRQTVVSTMDRIRLSIGLAVLISAIAGLGLYQHYVFYPSARAEYQKLATELEQTERPEDLQIIQSQLREMGVPEDEPAKTLFLQRLINSSEPFGFFALANTFAGILAVGFVLLLGMMVGSWQKFPMGHRIFFVIMIAVVGYCLLLTKSRSAQIGTLVGVVLLGVRWFQSATQLSAKKMSLIVGLTAWVLALAVGLAIATGGLDIQVLSEAPKSLIYRLEYWQGTLAVISENPLFGVGPGNFRQAYLQHKLPESSEEIADPHNMILDVWANGGLIALLGLLLMLYFIIQYWRNRSGGKIQSHAESPGETSSIPWPLVPSLTVSISLTYILPLLLGVSLDDRIFVVGAVAAIILFVLERSNLELQPSRSVIVASLIALSVHLLGAGGIGMPAILQVMLLCLVLSTGEESNQLQFSVPSDIRAIAIWAILSVVGLSATGTIAYRLFVATVALEDSRYAKTAAAFLRAINNAAESAPLSPEPWAYLAGHRQNECRQSQKNEEQATRALEEAISRNPKSAPLHAQMGDWQFELYEKTEDIEYADRATQAYQKAVELYPTNARNLAKLTFVLAKMGKRQEAEEVALQTLRQDQTNRRFGHVDKVLDEKTLEKLRSLIGSD